MGTKEESFDKEMNLYEDVEDAVEESYEDDGASYGESDESYGDEEGSYEDYEGFYDEQEELFGADQDDKDSSESQMRFSESDVRIKIGKQENERDSDGGVEVEKKTLSTGLASEKKFSDLNGLTDLDLEKKNDG